MTDIVEGFAAMDAFIADGGEPWNVVATEVAFLGHPVNLEAVLREALQTSEWC